MIVTDEIQVVPANIVITDHLTHFFRNWFRLFIAWEMDEIFDPIHSILTCYGFIYLLILE